MDRLFSGPPDSDDELNQLLEAGSGALQQQQQQPQQPQQPQLPRGPAKPWAKPTGSSATTAGSSSAAAAAAAAPGAKPSIKKPSNRRRAQNAAAMRKCRRKEKDAKAQLSTTVEVLGNSVDSLEERLGTMESLVWSNASVMDSLPLPAAPNSGDECKSWFRNYGNFWTESRRVCERFLRGWLSEPGDVHIEGEHEALRWVRSQMGPQETCCWDTMDRIAAHFHQSTPALLLAFVRWSQLPGPEPGGGGGDGSMVDTAMFNASAAKRRVHRYLEFLQKHKVGLEMVLADGGKAVRATYQHRSGYYVSPRLGQQDGSVVVQQDVARADLDTLNLNDAAALTFFLGHTLLFDPDAQQNGVIMAINFRAVAFDEFRSWWSGETPAVISLWHTWYMDVLPIRVNRVHLQHAPDHVHFLYNVLKIFLPRSFSELTACDAGGDGTVGSAAAAPGGAPNLAGDRCLRHPLDGGELSGGGSEMAAAMPVLSVLG